MNYLVLISVALLGAAHAAPNHLKHVTIDKQVVVNSGGNLGASASWGPFSAGAGLGDTGASAGAIAPGAVAGAGLGGSSASASASASAGSGSGTFVSGGHGGPTIFDQIFNIPISVLKTVNSHLNNKGVSVTASHGSAGAGAGASAGASAGAEASASADASSHVHTRTADAGASAGTQTGTGSSTVTIRKNYDSIFAIPISALSSVNQLLNG